MDFIKSLLPVEWSIRFFEPETDTEPGAHIYLHIPATDTVLRFRQNISRYDVVEFIKELHDNHDITTPAIIESASMLFLINTIITDKDSKTLLEQLSPLQKQAAIFMRDSVIEIEHDKTETGAWITSIFKQFGTDPSDKPVALITNNDVN